MASLRTEIITEWRSCGVASRFALILLLLSLLPLANLLWNRIFLNFDFDRTPYEHMAQIERVIVGKSVYEAPSAEHVSITYTPLYWWISGGVCKVTGGSLVWPRLVSLASSLAIVVLL